MWTYILHAKNAVVHCVVGMDRTEWYWVFGAMVLFGIFCMRGFGSRKNY